MIINAIKVLNAHRWQAIKDLSLVELPSEYRGLPKLYSKGLTPESQEQLVNLCPTGAISSKPLRLNMGRCLFCGQCARRFPDNVTFTNSWRTWGFTHEDLVVQADIQRDELEAVECEKPKLLFNKTLKLRQVSAGGDGACEMELNACGNVNFDMSRFGIEFVASPRHADALVITGPVTKNMSRELEATLGAMAEPRLIIAVGADAISGGLFVDSPAIDRSFFERHTPDLYIPGHPAHPLTFIEGVLALVGNPLDVKEPAVEQEDLTEPDDE